MILNQEQSLMMQYIVMALTYKNGGKIVLNKSEIAGKYSHPVIVWEGNNLVIECDKIEDNQ